MVLHSSANAWGGENPEACVMGQVVQDGAPKIAKLVYKWLNAMVYGTYNYSYWGL